MLNIIGILKKIFLFLFFWYEIDIRNRKSVVKVFSFEVIDVLV